MDIKDAPRCTAAPAQSQPRAEVDRISMFRHGRADGRADGRALANLKWILPGSSKVWTLDQAWI